MVDGWWMMDDGWWKRLKISNLRSQLLNLRFWPKLNFTIIYNIHIIYIVIYKLTLFIANRIFINWDLRFETIVKMEIWVVKSVNPDPCIFGQFTKFYYFCIVNKNDGIGAQGNKNLLSGLAKFSACPERKKEIANGDEVSKPTIFY